MTSLLRPAAALLEGLLLGYVISIPIGPVNIAVAEKALAGERRSALAVGAGSALVDGGYCILVSRGLSPLLAERTRLSISLWALGGALLVLLGVLAMTRSPQPQTHSRVAHRMEAAGKPFLLGVALTILNPTTAVSWSSLGTLLLSPLAAANGWLSAGLPGVGVIIGTNGWFTTVVISLERGRRLFEPRTQRRLYRIVGLAMLAFGLFFLARSFLAGIELCRAAP
jgi:threonine/homoserine/homoserine lactone efflux protein